MRVKRRDLLLLEGAVAVVDNLPNYVVLDHLLGFFVYGVFFSFQSNYLFIKSKLINLSLIY